VTGGAAPSVAVDARASRQSARYPHCVCASHTRTASGTRSVTGGTLALGLCSYRTMRTFFLATLMVCAELPAQAAMALPSRPILRVAAVGQFGTTPYPSSAIVSSVLQTGAPAGQPFYARTAGIGSDARNSFLSSLGFSSEPVQVSMDPRRDAPYRMVYSRCAGSGAMAGCALFAQVRGEQVVEPVVVTPAVVGTRDRLPSTYGGATAFARSRVGSASAELRYAATIGGPSSRVPGGPGGTSAAGPLGVAMHGEMIAYVWSWRTKRAATAACGCIDGAGPPRRW
jgi:hypothetical protein